ncbi:unnamed protein product [Staurois parvus]|uniref:Uncharacterized protein n=1 Tax=Staurois parvus TaxID=386267 RepID=A0ABN9BP00_9NEOB|nr:unnamed protein product [Staurois parvus]
MLLCFMHFQQVIWVCTRGGLTIWKPGHCPRAPGSVGGPMRCPWYLFHRLF